MSYILIIGAKSDVAKELAKCYAKNKFNIYLAARNSKVLKYFASDLEIRTGQKVELLDLDVLKVEDHKSFYDSLREKPFGVITTVGYLGDQKLGEIEFAEANKIFLTNFLGITSLLNIIVNDFEKRNSGFLIGISSVAGDRGRKKNYFYGSSKAAFSTYLSGVRNRLNSKNINVLTVKPGFIYTKMTENLKLPRLLTTSPKNISKDIFNAQKKNKQILYTKRIWLLIMIIIKLIPEKFFKKLNF